MGLCFILLMTYLISFYLLLVKLKYRPYYIKRFIITSIRKTPSVNRLVIQNDLSEVPHAEVRPQRCDELVLGLIRLVEQEITESDFIASPDENVGLTVEATIQLFIKIFSLDFPVFQLKLALFMQLS